jgi:hypothetical protein
VHRHRTLDPHVGPTRGRVDQHQRRVGVTYDRRQLGRRRVGRERDLDHALEGAGEAERERAGVLSLQGHDTVARTDTVAAQQADGVPDERLGVDELWRGRGHGRSAQPSAGTSPTSATSSAGVRRIPMTKSPNSANRADASS